MAVKGCNCCSIRRKSDLHQLKKPAEAGFVHTVGQSSNPLWADLGLTMAFVEDVKRGNC